MEDKFIVFFSDEEDIEDLACEFKHGFYETEIAIIDSETQIYTTQMGLLNTRLFELGYRVFVREMNNDMFEIKLGDNERTNREIRMGHNLFKMWCAGEFRKN
ncbi:hypothetical protein [Anaerovorax sp. IOR16]|uniref:hypothetical protein n=1 Tax=Anaerovorax sp. IOR16 TaxID=2773458 RepID=UPI0019D296AE|nr:hypothetical protein [Anaerovorax sp. IOR16]